MEKFYKKIEETTKEYLKNKNKKYRKEFSQFFTSNSIAELMASKIEIDSSKKEISLLEPSAGLGALIYSSVLRLKVLDIKKIEITAVEYDFEVCKILENNLHYLKTELKNEVDIRYKVINANFLELFGEKWEEKQLKLGLMNNKNGEFDIIVSNPPFKKLGKDSKENKYFYNFIIGQPNIYHLFIALSLKLLKECGQYIVISPKNYLGGKYTEKLREFLFNNYSVVYLHLFDERNKIFGNEVLQEISIAKIVNEYKENIEITYNEERSSNFYIQIKKILSPSTYTLLFPRNKEDIELLNENIKEWKSLKEQNLKFNIGKIVQFRVNEEDKGSKKYIFERQEVPLLISNHVKRNEINYQEIGNNVKEKIVTIRLNDRTIKKLINNENYVIFRKNVDYESENFIQAALYRKDFFKAKYLAIDNNIAYINSKDGELSLKRAQAICDYLNSKKFEFYFKLINHSHTMNSYDIENMLFPIF